jgi:hypothetical protein
MYIEGRRIPGRVGEEAAETCEMRTIVRVMMRIVPLDLLRGSSLQQAAADHSIRTK